ncbi:hypothetical protein AKJ57_01230 [candidate division MSBL1 archaeon SCGC-AAA259A05]|uniref:Uncharacterized protein n=1 Tax=candidate division MSBL1 archaeon SCGC-AAA259A05 TaxID=1698259 RepID=A0A133UB36_9EURY|nr:hypothetical protein AKJ57_01230 [candidate division MSBL1 archaeon SCGC-AAA259A05]
MNIVIEMPKSISKSTAKLLKDITGEADLDLAMRATLKDALEHRLEEIERKEKEFREKSGMEFEEFEESWEDGKIKGKYSYDVESDYWGWEGLKTRRKKIEEALKWVG